MSDLLTLDEFAKLTGERKKRIEELRDAGLIGRDGAFRRWDVARVRLIHDLIHHGFTIEELAEAARDPESTFSRYMEHLSERWLRRTFSLKEVARATGIDEDVACKLLDAGGLRDQEEMLDQDDILFFRSCKIALDAGYPLDALCQLLRVYSDALTRVAEVESRTTHFYLHDKLRAEGVELDEAEHIAHHTAGRLTPLVEPAILYFHRKGVARAEWDDMVMHLEADREGHVGETPGEIRRAIMFIDLANFTPLAEAMGDARAAQVLERFAEIVRFANIRCHGRVVKQIGDAFLVVFPEPYSAVSCALEVEERVSKEPHFPPVRAGIHWGPVLYREADYVGSNVNIASRLAAEASRHQILVTGEVWRRAKDLPGASFTRLGKRKLKGIAREIEVYEVASAGREAVTRETDPVCGMELGPGEAAARLTIDGVERAFCSDDCLRKFVKDPQKYALAIV